MTDANVVLGYLPSNARLGGDMVINGELAAGAVQKIATALDMPVKKAAEGIIDIVNENMFGALRLVSVEQGYDPRDFALVAFGGAGPLHANALGKLMGSWPVIIPPGPGVLCAYGDATTRLRDEASRTMVRRFDTLADADVVAVLDELVAEAAKTLKAEGLEPADLATTLQIDVRYHGQGLGIPVSTTLEAFRRTGLQGLGRAFDHMHTQLFTFALDAEHELVTLRAIVQGPAPNVKAEALPQGDADCSAALIERTTVFVEGSEHEAGIYDRTKLKTGNRVPGPAIVAQMDTTTLILPGHSGEVDVTGCILIRPNA